MSLNPNAAAFTMSAGAASFVPGGSFKPAAAAPAPEAAPAAEPVAEPEPAPAADAPVVTEKLVIEDDKDFKIADDDPELLAELAAMQLEDDRKAMAKAADKKVVDVPEVEGAAAAPAAAAPAAASTAVSTKKSSGKSSSKKKNLHYEAHDTREHLNIVLIGHVDAGKSTISGQILLLTDQVDKRTIEKYEREAKDKNRESWYLAYIMDTNEEERAKGKTVEVGRAHFTTKNKRYTLLDAPGHKNYVPNMIGGTSQADVGVLVISARRGEFETGFDRGGQTREHAMLAKTLGIQKMVVLVNKMDEPTVNWSQKRFMQVQKKLTPFLKKWGFNIKRDVTYCPCSGFTGANLKIPVSKEICPWLEDRRSFFQILEGLKPLNRKPDGPVRVPVMARYKDMGAVCVLGKLESGTLRKDDAMVLMPIGKKCTVAGLLIEDEEVDMAVCGENIVVQLKGVEEDEIHEGFVLCSMEHEKPKKTTVFEGQMHTLGLLEHKPLITAGYTAVLHAHALVAECTIAKLVSGLDKKTKKEGKIKFIKSQTIAKVIIEVEDTIAIETFKDMPQLGRFTLRDEGKTIAVGKVTRILRKKKKTDAA